jgi:hypothetical protein
MEHTPITPGMELATLPANERAAIALSSPKTEAQLRELVTETASIIEVKDSAGREQAHRAGMKLKGARTTIEKTGKAAREDAQAFSKAVIAEEKRLVTIIEGEEKRVLGLRDTFDAEQARIKAEAEAKERARVAAIRAKIDAIKNLPMGMHGEPSAEIETELAALREFQAGDDFAEFKDEAQAAAASAIEALEAMLARVKAQEEEAARLAAERAELERLRAEQAERERIQAEREKAQRDAELALEAERQRLAEEQRRQEEANERERLRLAEEAAELDRRKNPLPSVEEAMEDCMASVTAMREAREDREALEAAIFDAATTGTGVASISLTEQGLTVEHIPTAELTVPCNSEQPMLHGQLVFDISYYAAEQFRAMADKVAACGFATFADQLRSTAVSMEAGDYKDAIAGADLVALLAADKGMLDATARSLSAIEIHAGNGEAL